MFPKLRSLRFSGLRCWSPGIRGESWARLYGPSKLQARRAGWVTSACTWQSGWLLDYARITCLSFCLVLISHLLTDFLFRGKSIPRYTENYLRKETMAEKREMATTLTCSHRKSCALSKDKLPVSWIPTVIASRTKTLSAWPQCFSWMFPLVNLLPWKNHPEISPLYHSFCFPLPCFSLPPSPWSSIKHDMIKVFLALTIYFADKNFHPRSCGPRIHFWTTCKLPAYC